MYVGILNLCALRPSHKGNFHKAVIARIGRRVRLAQVFGRKLVFVPLDLRWLCARKQNSGRPQPIT